MKNIVLVVEDDEDLLRVYTEILQMNGFDVKKATNGQEAISIYKEAKPGLVIMDGDMPILNGYDAFFEIKRIDSEANVVMVTGYSDFEKQGKSALQHGLLEIVSKPIGLDKLLELTKKFCIKAISKK